MKSMNRLSVVSRSSSVNPAPVAGPMGGMSKACDTAAARVEARSSRRADRMAAMEHEVRALKSHVTTLEGKAAHMRAGVADVPGHVTDSLAELAARAEALAAAVEERFAAA